jgi:hypothetical protein
MHLIWMARQTDDAGSKLHHLYFLGIDGGI